MRERVLYCSEWLRRHFLDEFDENMLPGDCACTKQSLVLGWAVADCRAVAGECRSPSWSSKPIPQRSALEVTSASLRRLPLWQDPQTLQ